MSVATHLPNVDLKKNMQEMKLAFKQAAEAQSIEEMQKPIVRLRYASGRTKNRCVYPVEKKKTSWKASKKISLSIR